MPTLRLTRSNTRLTEASVRRRKSGKPQHHVPSSIHAFFGSLLFWFALPSRSLHFRLLQTLQYHDDCTTTLLTAGTIFLSLRASGAGFTSAHSQWKPKQRAVSPEPLQANASSPPAQLRPDIFLTHSHHTLRDLSEARGLSSGSICPTLKMISLWSRVRMRAISFHMGLG